LPKTIVKECLKLLVIKEKLRLYYENKKQISVSNSDRLNCWGLLSHWKSVQNIKIEKGIVKKNYQAHMWEIGQTNKTFGATVPFKVISFNTRS
jgi:hypothetical protein